MSNESSLFAGKGGNYSFGARLNTVRGKLMEISGKVSQLESNIIFLLVHPFLVNPPPVYTSNDDNENQDENDTENNFDVQPVIIENLAEEEWESHFIIDSSLVRSKLSECLTIEHALSLEEKELVEGFNEEKKKHGKEPDEVISLHGHLNQ